MQHRFVIYSDFNEARDLFLLCCSHTISSLLYAKVQLFLSATPKLYGTKK